MVVKSLKQRYPIGSDAEISESRVMLIALQFVYASFAPLNLFGGSGKSLENGRNFQLMQILDSNNR